MDKQELQQFIDKAIKEAHLVGKIEGEKTNSNLVHEILHRIEPAVEKSIEKHVNGKIRAIDAKIDAKDAKFDAYVIEDNNWKETFSKEDKKWKDEAMPVLEAGTKALNFGTVGMIGVKALTAIGILVGMIYTFFRWIK